MRDVDLPPDLRSLVSRELNAGERVVWQSRPVPAWFTAASVTMFLLAIPWTAFAVFWAWGAGTIGPSALPSGVSTLFALFEIPFILIGIGMLTSPIWFYRQSLKTVYVITDQRALSFVQGWWSLTVRSYSPAQLGSLTRRERADGSGDLMFERREWCDSDGDRRREELGFLRVPDVRQVEQLVTSLARQVS